jgi:hypothetical protein
VFGFGFGCVFIKDSAPTFSLPFCAGDAPVNDYPVKE